MNKFNLLATESDSDDNSESPVKIINSEVKAEVKKEELLVKSSTTDKKIIYELIIKFDIESVLNDNIELMHRLKLVFWEYLDVYVVNNKAINDFNNNTYKFYEYCFYSYKVLAKRRREFRLIYDDYKYDMDCKNIAGVFLINTHRTHVCMTKTTFNKNDFPKGKIDINENVKNAAIRECLEETGYDCSKQISDSDEYIISFDVKIKHLNNRFSSKTVTMFIILDVPMDFNFKCSTSKYESVGIEWKLIDKIENYYPFIFKQMKDNLRDKIKKIRLN